MVNEDIVTALKNAIDRGESLESAMQILINSGYGLQDVEEASYYISKGAISMTEIKNNEHFAMPQQKNYFFQPSLKPAYQQSPTTRPQNIQPAPYTQPMVSKQIQTQPTPQQNQFIPQSQPIQTQNAEIKKSKNSYGLEIFLIIILLILIGVLVSVILYKEQILEFLSR